MVQKGYNSDVEVGGRSFHLQTEDWGADNPYLVSRVFSGGAVVRSIKTSYREIFAGMDVDAQAVRLAMKVQHQRILDLLLSGQLPTA